MASPATAGNLVEIADPPVPSRTTPVREMSLGEKLKIAVILLGAGVGLCALGYWLLQNGSPIRGTIAGLFGLFCVIAGFSSKALTAACPYCGAKIDTIARKNRGEGEQVHCEKCHEYSIVNAGLVRPLDPATTSPTPKFESPVFRDNIWPKGCVACGAPPVRFDDLSKTTVGAPAAVLGGLQIIRGSVSGIPYCEKHRNSLSLKVSVDKKLILCWTSLRMMRRYLAAHRNGQTY